MSSNLYITILVFAGIMLVNVVTSAALWYIHRNRIFGYITLSWVITAVNFFLQSQFTVYDSKMLLAFSFYVLASWVYYEITAALLHNYERRSWVYTIPVTLVLLGLVTLEVTGSYRMASFFCAVAIAMPLICAALKARKPKNPIGDTKGFKVLALLLTLLAIHYLDYPFLRQIEKGAVFGYTMAFLLTFAFSIFFPSFLLWQLAAQYSSRLEQEVTKQTKELVDLDNRNKALISILVHDLATPVTTAMMSITKMENDQKTPILDKLGRSLRHIMMTIDKVRELQAVSLGKKSLDLQPTNPLGPIQGAIQYQAEMMAVYSLNMHLKDYRRDKNSNVLVDTHLLQAQIIGNLLSNAIKFSPKGEDIVVRISDDSEYLSIEVIDFGIGIPSNIASSLFQYSGATTRRGLHDEKGTGLGLPLVKAYVDMMHGKIDFKTNYRDDEFSRDVGVNMRVRFPLVVKQPILSPPSTQMEM
ncbi:sensor histidine kinase [Bdellovibrio sp. HCB209]|uniref:sensor histidine kinase n=1 Tax=Bdellovibrio sp. HCB209 TaxID=3394354 RepID=UPI0039B4B0A1